MMRLACSLLMESGVNVVAPFHDGFMIEGPADAIDENVARGARDDGGGIGRYTRRFPAPFRRGYCPLARSVHGWSGPRVLGPSYGVDTLSDGIDRDRRNRPLFRRVDRLGPFGTLHPIGSLLIVRLPKKIANRIQVFGRI
jgi:hypothetical protein